MSLGSTISFPASVTLKAHLVRILTSLDFNVLRAECYFKEKQATVNTFFPVCIQTGGRNSGRQSAMKTSLPLTCSYPPRYALGASTRSFPLPRNPVPSLLSRCLFTFPIANVVVGLLQCCKVSQVTSNRP